MKDDGQYDRVPSYSSCSPKVFFIIARKVFDNSRR